MKICSGNGAICSEFFADLSWLRFCFLLWSIGFDHTAAGRISIWNVTCQLLNKNTFNTLKIILTIHLYCNSECQRRGMLKESQNLTRDWSTEWFQHFFLILSLISQQKTAMIKVSIFCSSFFNRQANI